MGARTSACMSKLFAWINDREEEEDRLRRRRRRSTEEKKIMALVVDDEMVKAKRVRRSVRVREKEDGEAETKTERERERGLVDEAQFWVRGSLEFASELVKRGGMLV
ncbi:hypothetical protein P8452_08908 [Trifolium repens]|nr:hypothetical protein P8452_08908 [Trifolium repens]